MSRAWRLRPAPRPVEAWETEGSPAPHDSPVPRPRLLLGDAGDLMQGTPGQPLARRGAAPCQERGSPLPGERRPSQAPIPAPLAPPLLGAAVSSETMGFHQGIISSQQGQPQFGSSGFMDNKKACPVKKCSWQPHDASSSGMQSRRNVSGRVFRYPSTS